LLWLARCFFGYDSTSFFLVPSPLATPPLLHRVSFFFPFFFPPDTAVVFLLFGFSFSADHLHLPAFFVFLSFGNPRFINDARISESWASSVLFPPSSTLGVSPLFCLFSLSPRPFFLSLFFSWSRSSYFSWSAAFPFPGAHSLNWRFSLHSGELCLFLTFFFFFFLFFAASLPLDHLFFLFPTPSLSLILATSYGCGALFPLWLLSLLLLLFVFFPIPASDPFFFLFLKHGRPPSPSLSRRKTKSPPPFPSP